MENKEKIAYLLNMAARMPHVELDPERWNRWLGFMQGALWALELKTIDAMRHENRKSLHEAFEEAVETLKKAKAIG